MKTVKDIRLELKQLHDREQYVTDKTGVRMLEICGAQFVADEPIIYGNDNQEYIKRELQWYHSQSLNVNDIPPPVPQVWLQVATPDGRINSNYGWAIYSTENGSQYNKVLTELRVNPESRRGQMIYTRPSMHSDYCHDGMSDFMCCSNTVHQIRNGRLLTHVYFRSNDAVFGYKNDWAWIQHVHHDLATDLQVEPGNVIWNAASLHVYERHFNFLTTQETT